MRTTVRLVLSALAASMLLALALSTASASRLSTTNQNFRITWRSLEFAGEGATIRCPLTLEGSFHTRTIAKVERALVGAVNKANVNSANCTNGTIATFNGVERYNGTTSPNTLPWHLTYLGFTGTLPNITAVIFLLERDRFGWISSGLCTGQYGTSEDRIGFLFLLSAGVVGEASPREGQNIAHLSRRDGGLVCPSQVTLRGSGAVTLQGAPTRITLTLI